MNVFDVPDRAACAVRRSSTNTPLQALATLNDELFLECTMRLAARTLREANTDRERMIVLFRRATGRRPDQADLRTLEQGLSALLGRCQAAPADAANRTGTRTQGTHRLSDCPFAAHRLHGKWVLLSPSVMIA